MASLPPTTTNIVGSAICVPSSFLSNPLFSTLVTLFLLILLYLPHPFLTILLSPLLISNSLLLFLLRLGTSQLLNGPHRPEFSPVLVTRPPPIRLDHGATHQREEGPNANRVDTRPTDEPQPRPGPLSPAHHSTPQQRAEAPNSNQVETRPSNEPEPRPDFQSYEKGRAEMGVDQLKEGGGPHCSGVEMETRKEIPGRVGSEIPKPEAWPDPGPNLFCRETCFVGRWEVGAPLEVIYEAYEGEEGVNDENDAFHEDYTGSMEKYYPSLSRCYPESDSCSSSDSECSSWLWEGEFPEMELGYGEEEERDQELIEIAPVIHFIIFFPTLLIDYLSLRKTHKIFSPLYIPSRKF